MHFNSSEQKQKHKTKSQNDEGETGSQRKGRGNDDLKPDTNTRKWKRQMSMRTKKENTTSRATVASI